MADRGPGGQFAGGNIFGSSALGFGVGNKEFLNSAESKSGKYFRSIEFGTEGFEGKLLIGLWGFGRRGAPPPGDLRGFGMGFGEQFFPMGHAAAAKYLREHGMPRRTSGRVGHEIVGMEAYRRAAESFDPGAREREAIIQAFKDSGLDLSREGKGRRAPSKAASKEFLASNLRGRFLTGQATSQYGRSLGQIDKVFRSELTEANRLLAEGLAAEVALIQRERLKRPQTSSGKLEDATLDRRNRFPS